MVLAVTAHASNCRKTFMTLLLVNDSSTPGMVAWLLGMSSLLLVVRLIGERTDA